jgi:acyl transferase domain-containing protein
MEAKGRLLSRGCVHALEDAGIAPRGYLGRR